MPRINKTTGEIVETDYLNAMWSLRDADAWCYKGREQRRSPVEEREWRMIPADDAFRGVLRNKTWD